MAKKIRKFKSASHEYWFNREEEARKHYITDEKEYEKRLNKIYSDMFTQINKEINGFYGKYAKTEGISISEAKKRVSQIDIEEYKAKAKKYVDERDFSKEANTEMKLYNATMEINRLEMLKSNIGLELVKGHDELQKELENILDERYRKEVERQASILGESVKLNARNANAMINASFWNATFSDRVWMYQGMLKTELDTLLRQGLIQGYGSRELATHLVKRFGVNKDRALTLMRTELQRVQMDAELFAIKESGYDDYMYIAEPTACPICAKLDGKTFKLEEAQSGDNMPPMHPNCRCTIAAYMDEEEFEEWLKSLDKPERNYEKLTIDEYKKLTHKITKEERKIVYGKGHWEGYLNSANAKKINSALRNGEALSAEFKNIADTLQSIIERNKLGKDIVATRYIGVEGLYAMTNTTHYFSGIRDRKTYMDMMDALPGIVGKDYRYTEKGFFSVSGVEKNNVMQRKDVMMTIKIPGNVNAYVSTNYKESEIILGQGTQLLIRNIKRAPHRGVYGYELECEVIYDE